MGKEDTSGQEQTEAREEVAEALENNDISKRPVRGKQQVSYAEPKRGRSCKSKKDQPAMPSTDIAASNAEVFCFAKTLLML